MAPMSGGTLELEYLPRERHHHQVLHEQCVGLRDHQVPLWDPALQALVRHVVQYL